MKKLLLLVMTVTFSTALFISCSSSSKAKITVLEDDAEYLTDVYNLNKLGEEGIDFIQIVPGTYNVISKGGSLSTTIPLKIVEGKKYPSYKAHDFLMYVTDNKDNYIKIGSEKVEFKAEGKEAAYKALCNASIGEIVNVTFKYTPANPEDLNTVLAAISSCEIELLIEASYKD